MRLPRIPSQQSPAKSRKLGALSAAAAVAAAALLSGCNAKSFLDPSELTRGGVDKRQTVKILDQIEPGMDDYDPRFPAAQDPRPEDLQSTISDYTMGPGDVVDVAVTDLTGTGVESVNTRQVTESGNIILPLLKQPVRSEGLTEPELAQAVAQAYKAENIIQDAQVSVTLRVKRARTFYIRGAIGAPGEYEIATNDFRLLNALVQARDVSGQAAAGVDYIFVIRKTKFDPGNAGQQGTPGTTTPGNRPPAGRDPLAPQSSVTPSNAAPASHRLVKPVALMQNNPAPDAPTAANAPATVPTAGETEGRFIIVDGKPVQVGAQPQSQQAQSQQSQQPRANAAVAAQNQPPRTGAGTTGARTGAAAQPQGARTGTQGRGAAGGFQFNSPNAAGDTRVIRIPFDRLRNGELQYNVVIRPQDMIVVPEPRVQTYYMGGHVAAPGAYQMIPGNKLTLMEAVISARMLDGLAIPARTDVIRRVGDEKVWVRVDLDKIFAGQQPDLYLKENDNIMVGTNAAAPFLAAFRNAFRVTYGFGFLYDRNFAAEDNNAGINDNN